MTRPLALLWLLCGSVLGHAQAPTKYAPTAAEFDLRLPMSSSGNNGVLQLELPRQVYLHSRAARLADLRLFNAAGDALPFHLYQPRRKPQTQLRDQLSVLFPLYSSQRRDQTSELRLQIAPGADGSLLWTGSKPSEAAEQSKLTALIVDLGGSDKEEWLHGVHFAAPIGSSNYSARVVISRSEDLQFWDDVAVANLDWISSTDAASQLVNDYLEIPNGRGRYLKLAWISGEPAEFAAITGHWRKTAREPDSSLELIIDGSPAEIAGDYAYQSSPSILATEIGLELAQINTVLPVSIGVYHQSRPSGQVRLPGQTRQATPRTWFEPRINATFYRLLRDGEERKSGRIQIGAQSSESWIVRSQQATSTPPQLVLRWQPQTLVFNARGEGLQLAVGADPQRLRQWSGGPSPLEQVAPGFNAEEIAGLEFAQLGERAQSAPVAERVPDAEPPPDPALRRRLILWAVLGLGVIMLASISWRLYVQINAAPNQHEDS